MNPREIILAPVQSEKSFAGLANDRYTFRVHPDADKGQIRAALLMIYPKVTVVEVATSTVKSKPKRRGAIKGIKPGYKKAVIQVKPGDQIPIFEGVH